MKKLTRQDGGTFMYELLRPVKVGDIIHRIGCRGVSGVIVRPGSDGPPTIPLRLPGGTVEVFRDWVKLRES